MADVKSEIMSRFLTLKDDFLMAAKNGPNNYVWSHIYQEYGSAG